MRTEWWKDAECREMDWTVFFNTHIKSNRDQAYAACRVCPVVEICLYYGLSSEEPGISHRYGVYGFTSPDEREKMKMPREDALNLYETLLEEYRERRT